MISAMSVLYDEKELRCIFLRRAELETNTICQSSFNHRKAPSNERATVLSIFFAHIANRFGAIFSPFFLLAANPTRLKVAFHVQNFVLSDTYIVLNFLSQLISVV